MRSFIALIMALSLFGGAWAGTHPQETSMEEFMESEQ